MFLNALGKFQKRQEKGKKGFSASFTWRGDKDERQNRKERKTCLPAMEEQGHLTYEESQTNIF